MVLTKSNHSLKLNKKKKKSNQTYMIILKLIHYHIIKAMAVYNIIQNHNIQYLFYKKKNSYVS